MFRSRVAEHSMHGCQAEEGQAGLELSLVADERSNLAVLLVKSPIGTRHVLLTLGAFPHLPRTSTNSDHGFSSSYSQGFSYRRIITCSSKRGMPHLQTLTKKNTYY